MKQGGPYFPCHNVLDGGIVGWLEQVLVWGFSFSAVVHHCPWCADWPRASHVSPSRFCLVRDTELWWMVIISPLCGEIVGKEIPSSNHFHPSAPAVLCLPDLLSSSGYHASSVFETCQNILSLKKDTFGISIIGIYCSWPTGSLTQQLYLKHSNQPAKANKIPQTKW